MNTIIAEGECGRSGNARWQLDDTGRLTISGTGSTSVYSFSIPWEKYIDKITCVTYMEGITDISDDLSGMINVRRLELSSTVTSIFGRFENCSKLSEIIVTDNLTYISDLALEDTLWYKRQPRGMVYLGRIFYGCKGGSKDSTVKIKEGTLGIARGAFRYTNENIHIDIPSSVKCIAHSAHTFPDKCECMSIGEINWTLEPGGKLYFGGDRGIMKDLKNADEQPWKYIRHNIRCAVKSSGIECKNIGKNIFAQCSIEEVMLGDTVEVISAGAFKNCTSLRRVTGLGKVRLIEKGAFSGCTALTEFEVPKLMKGISGQELVRYNEDNDIVFKQMTETTATIKELIGGYGENFTWSIDDSGTMRLIGEGIMPYNEKYNCSDKSFDDNKIRKMVRRLIIDERITEIGFKAFSGFTEMTAADLPVGLKRIGSDAFSDCVSLSRLIIPDSTKTIGDGAFSRSGLESIVIPKSVTKLADFAFLNCKKLTQITLPESVMPRAFVFKGFVTFSYLKRGALLFPGREFCGKLMLKNAGIFRPDDLGKAFDAPAPFPRETEAGLFLPEKEDMASLLPPRGMRSHKGTYGRTVLFAGSEDMPGAARMAAEAAYRSGTGLVQICSSASNRAVFAAALPEAVFTCEEKLRSEDYMNSVLEKAGAVLLGSGWGLREDALKILEYVLKTYRGTIVLDADALNLISAFGWPERRTEDEQRVIITPHLLEMSRLSGKDPGYIQSHLTETAESYAREHKVICVLKDATSVVTDGSRSFLITSGCGGMSTGGSGDVLAGLTAGIAAQRTGPLESAVSGAFLHGLAGTKAAVNKGERGMLAGDIIAEIPYVLKELEK